MEVSKWMKRNVVSIAVSANIGAAAALFAEKHVGLLPVLDENRRLVGVLHLRDLLKLVMPAFVELIEDFDFVQGDLGIYESLKPSREAAAQPVSTVMESPVSVKASSGLLLAFALMENHDLYDLPVIDEQDRLIGLVSEVDVGTALLANWHRNPL